MYKIYEDTRWLLLRPFDSIAVLSTTVLRIHFDGDFVVESGSELLDVALKKLVRLWIRCFIVGRRYVLVNSFHGRLIFLKCKNKFALLQDIVFFEEKLATI